MNRILNLTILIVLLLNTEGVYSNYKSDKGKPVSAVDSLDQKNINWYNLDGLNDNIYGASVEKCYEYLSNKTVKKNIVVAVIDAGIDIHHEDIKSKIWINKDEVPDNGVDDDNNGYIDDVNGWNFIGNKDGVNIKNENLEFVRLYRSYKNQFYNKNKQDVPSSLMDNYNLFTESKEKYESERNKYLQRDKRLTMLATRVLDSETKLKNFLKQNDLTKDDIEKVSSSDESVLKAKSYMLYLYRNGYSLESFRGMREHVDLYLDTLLNLNFIAREKIIGDNINDFSDLDYGNNNVIGPKADHGTHVAGIIGADRTNKIGIKGVASNVTIMPVRTIPKGDEYDKDVALAIRYAVDNGANIINMSFGKESSPQKHMVDEAVKYAESKNVLLIHAAGNSGVNIDNMTHYPDSELSSGQLAKNWISVGASSSHLDKEFVGVFSNYGRNKVDLFAPGVDVVSLFPGDKYVANSGTSMACPVVSGVAALIWSYYPELSAQQLRAVLLESVQEFSKHKVYKPALGNSKKKKTKFGKLSGTGGIVNAYLAAKAAEQMVKE
ncbi:MAG: S8 family serine peptidase [Carboxylicivirga sp.]|jgi:subtilisin family serine protease|nr:S8 family serine peptidase [Carboxylicivirga sp.]